jgi:hypothetical protein
MFPAPFFIAPFQPMIPPDFSQMPYDPSYAPEMFAVYPQMHFMMPVPPPANGPDDVGNGHGNGNNGNGSSNGANGAEGNTSIPVLPPFEPPQFGPGPPIVTGDKLKGPRGCNLFVFHLPNEITNWYGALYVIYYFIFIIMYLFIMYFIGICIYFFAAMEQYYPCISW